MHNGNIGCPVLMYFVDNIGFLLNNVNVFRPTAEHLYY